MARTIGATPRGTQVAVALEHVELATCLPYVLRTVDAYGRVDGTFDMEVGTGERNAGTGALEIRSAAWKPGGPLADDVLRADTATLA